MARGPKTHTVRPEPVDGLSFFTAEEKEGASTGSARTEFGILSPGLSFPGSFLSTVRAELVEALPFWFHRKTMSFWAYLLHCSDGGFYAGHTDDLDARIGAHQSGLIKGYTSTRLPVTLVWSDEFPSRYEALQAERQIKGWGRAKKLALIRGDWAMIRALARNSEEKDRASTGSARTAVDRSRVFPAKA